MAHDHCHCRDYTRSQLLRRGAAQAGKGLPSIETGMPLPAGTGLSARQARGSDGASPSRSLSDGYSETLIVPATSLVERPAIPVLRRELRLWYSM